MAAATASKPQIPPATASSLAATFKSTVRPLLDAIDRVRDILDGAEVTELQLPCIAVIGNQSAGTTSVLERLSGVNLPRGDGMVTRCALVLRMICKEGVKPHAEIKASKGDAETVAGRKIALDDVAKEVTRVTDALVAPNEISFDESISLTVVSPDVPDLTVIDLPGIVYVDAAGKASSIDKQIKDLYFKHIKADSCVILCALPANLDMGTQQAKAWADEVDPEGKRTLGVVTKIDKADASDLALGDRLLGIGRNAWAFNLGAVAMRNRSQDDIDKGASKEEVDRAEEEFFRSHEGLRSMKPDKKIKALGVQALVTRLVSIQTDAVTAALPTIIKSVRGSLEKKRAELRELPEACDSASECQLHFAGLLTRLVDRVAEAHAADYRLIHDFKGVRELVLVAEAEETADGGNFVYPHEVLELHMMPRLEERFVTFDAKVRDGPKIFAPPYRARVASAMKESAGCGLADKVSDVIFNKLVATEAAHMREPATDLVESVHDYMTGFCRALAKEHFSVFPHLESFAVAALTDFLAESRSKSLAHIAEQLNAEREAYTLNHYYSDTLGKVRKWQAERAEKAKNPTPGSAFRPTQWSDEGVAGILDGVTPTGELTGVEKSSGMPAKQAPCDADPVDNFSQGVLDTQIRLFCYRKVVQKRFVDQVVIYLRLHFPRRLRDAVGPFLRRKAIAPEDANEGGSGGDASALLLQLMAEPERQRDHRARLRASIERLERAEKELKRGGLQSFIRSS